MTSYQTLRDQLESVLAHQMLSALSPRPQTFRERMSASAPEIDVLLDGGLPAGVITELVGANGSGRTTVALAYASAVSREEKVVAWVDAGDMLDPLTAAHNGVELGRLLWIRCRKEKQEVRPVESAQVAGIRDERPAVSVRGSGSPHPRSEGRGMPQAIRSMMQAHGGLHDRHARRERKNIGTPGMPNRPLVKSPDREEQIPIDRLPSRRDKQAMRLPSPSSYSKVPKPHQRESGVGQKKHALESASQAGLRQKHERPWEALDHALRATDLLLQAGGFSLIVLDLGGTPPEISWRIPLSTWFRFRAACERSRTCLLLLTQHPCARSSAELVVRFEVGEMLAEGNVLTGFSFQAEIERQRFKQAENKIISIRKPAQIEKPGTWKGCAAWAV